MIEQRKCEETETRRSTALYELESDIDRKASERFHRKPYQSYTVEDYLKKMEVDITKGVDAGGQEHSK